MADLMDKVISLAKRRGFIYPGSQLYGGLANTWDFGPLGVELKNNIKLMWWERFVHRRSDIVGMDAAIIMNPKVWQASGHLAVFSDLLVECKKCHERFRADKLPSGGMDPVCPNCGSEKFTSPTAFNLMLKTFFGPTQSVDHTVYFRPETAQGMFVNFKNVLDSTRVTVPFGIAQVGKAFRNEITPGNFIFRTREFEQMEIEYFVREAEWQQHFEHWQGEMMQWMKDIGLDMARVHPREVIGDDLAHYSKRTVDFDFDFPFGRDELYGLAYRGDFDLKNHATHSGEDLFYRDPVTGETFVPHVIEPTWGVERSVLAMLISAYQEDGKRTILKLPAKLAPYRAAVFPLLANKPELASKAREIHSSLLADPLLRGSIAWDDRGNIGKRYFAQDEIGTPYCITVDFQTLEDNTVTVRDRDSAQQERVPVSSLITRLAA